MSSYLVNPHASIDILRGAKLSSSVIERATDETHLIVHELSKHSFDIFAVLGMRNLSAFIGEVFASAVVKHSCQLFRKNPHQDGYPDLLLMDDAGRQLWESLADSLRSKSPFSPFATGGIEVKATCGAVPTPKVLAKRGLEKPELGEQRISLVTGYDWKAHHRETNNLIGLVWDFIDRMPTIVGVFYSNALNENSWGEIVKPKKGGGRTTSVSIMNRRGVRTMYENWIVCLEDSRYTDFFNRYNSGDLISPSTPS